MMATIISSINITSVEITISNKIDFIDFDIIIIIIPNIINMFVLNV